VPWRAQAKRACARRLPGQPAQVVVSPVGAPSDKQGAASTSRRAARHRATHRSGRVLRKRFGQRMHWHQPSAIGVNWQSMGWGVERGVKENVRT